ncbi:protein HEG homolog 1 isoform X1 [Elephas maximus indicus]|uniref:protein HEG homolog 1 isoform X1 n=1 Tax=Elephas maximus indicus TaxID=99487 RepID=UPI00211635A2|nr:protein HEG homolog 1 isoform X1 [Elephas maximus indicus]
MASPRASRGPPLPLLLPLLLLLLLPPPAAPGPRGQPPSPASRAPSGAPLADAGLARPPEPGSERELQPLPPQHSRGPAPPAPSPTPSGPGVATRRGPSGRGRSAAAVRNHWPENNTEPHLENITFYQGQGNFSAVVSKEPVMVQTSRKSHTSSSAPEDFTLLTETANTGRRSDSLSGTDFIMSPAAGSPEVATALNSQNNTSAWEKLHWSSSGSESEKRIAASQTESGTLQGSLATGKGLPEEATMRPQVAATSVLSQSSLPALEMGEQTMFLGKRNSWGPELSSQHFSRTPAYTPPSDHSSSSGSIKELNNFTAFSSPSASQTESMHDATMFTDGVPRMLQSLPVSLGPVNETEHFPEYSEIAATSASVRSSPSVEESRRNSEVTGNLGNAEITEPSTENGFKLTSSEISMEFWQSDSPTSGGHQLATISDANNGSSISQTETVSRSVPSIEGGESTAHWSLTNSKMFVNGTGSSTSPPEAMNSSVLTQFSDSAPQPEGSTLSDRNYSEPSTESLSVSSSESLDPSASRGERSTVEGSHDVAGSSVPQEKTSGSHPHSPHTSATFTRGGERTLRSLTNGSTAPEEVGSSASVLRETESATQHLDVTEDTDFVSGSLAASHVLGVTGVGYGQLNGTDMEQRTSSDLTDHTYASSTFTKGERALLSITDNLDTRESSTSYIKISNSSHVEYSSSSHARTERSNASSSSYDGEYAQPSTESLVMGTPNPPSYTPTTNLSNTSILPDVYAEPVGDSSSSPSGAPLPLPSVSQSHQLFSSALPSTSASAPLLKSTSDAFLSSSPSPLPVSSIASTPASSTTAPSTPAPSTLAPSTLAPSTLAPSTLVPSTPAPSTPAPSTPAPSTPAPSSVSQPTLPRSSSTPVLPRARETSGTSLGTWTMASSIAMLHSSQTADPKNQSDPYQEKAITEPKSPSLGSLPKVSTEAGTVSSPSGVPLPPALTESSTKQTLPASSTSLAQVSPALRATTLETSHPSVTTVSLPSSTVALMSGTTIVQTTSGKQVLPISPEILVPQISTQDAVTTKRTQVHVDTTTRLIPLTSAPTSARELATRLSVTEEHSPASHFSRAPPSPQTTDVSTVQALTLKSTTFPAQDSTQSPTALSSPASVNICATNPCLHDGNCIADASSRGYRCVCSPSWRGDDCSVDVNECLLNPCPPLATCNNTQGSFTCKCPVGYQLEKGICNLVRTFVTEFKLKKTFLNTTMEKHSDLHEVENEITKMLNVCFSTLPGYTRSTAHASGESSMVVLSLQTTFSLASNVTLFDLADRIQRCVNSCRSSAEVCQLLGSQRRFFRAGSLCKRKSPECDRDTSICTDLDGIALCQCKSGYFQFNKMDHSCRACEDGYRLENETCMSCPFGLGGLNCGNPYQLITVVIAAAGGGLLLILGIALIVTCCRKNKNDISKLIFKSGDFQMSPYAEYPKNPRSQEWGREAIEMHENGSTKNLLQMTDVYYSPAGVRNPELERNGLYPAYTGLPGSRHSCIFPGQYNPSFISDESRRRDYF